eukprot:PITA_22753
MKAAAIEDLMKIENPEILMLQETKIEGEALLELSRINWKTKVGMVVSARGTSGGLSTVWMEELFQVENSFETQDWIYTELQHKANSYSPMNIVIAGDLNIVLDPKEKRGGNNSRDPLLPLVEDIIQQLDLLHLKPNKGRYMWTNNRTGVAHILARLDRFLVQSTLLMDKRIVSLRILPKLTSDYKPILLQLDEEENLGPILFHFNPLWIKQEGFMEVVDKAWSITVTGSPSYVWEKNKKSTKATLKEWVKTPPNTFTTHRKEIVQQLADLQWEMEDKDITTHELEKEQVAQLASFSSFRKEEEFWRLKSRSLWLKAGDQNTTFFHRQYRACLSQNHIS